MSRFRSHGSLDDAKLATLAGRGDAAAFEALYDRHHASLLAFCRHMLGSREDGEDALQQTFIRAHGALTRGRPPASVRGWLFAIARNRCYTMLAARRDAAVPAELPDVGFDGLADDVRRRADLRELLADLGRLPDDQRAALVLAELGDLSHAEIGAVIGCPPKKVKALVFQAREALVADREARCIPCEQVRGLLETATGNVLRRASLRRHLKQCAPCSAYRGVVSARGGLGSLLPVAPTAGLKAAVLGGAGVLGSGEGAAAGAAVLAAGGAAATGGTAGAVTLKAAVAKLAITAAVAGGGVAAVEQVAPPAREPAPLKVAAERPRAEVERGAADRVAGAEGSVTAAGGGNAAGTAAAVPAAALGRPTGIGRRAVLRRAARRAALRHRGAIRRRALRRARARRAALRRAATRRAAVRRGAIRRRAVLRRAATRRAALRRNAIRRRAAVQRDAIRQRAAGQPGPVGERRARRRAAGPSPEVVEPAPVARPERRRRPPVPSPTPVPSPEPTPTPDATATPEPTATP